MNQSGRGNDAVKQTHTQQISHREISLLLAKFGEQFCRYLSLVSLSISILITITLQTDLDSFRKRIIRHVLMGAYRIRIINHFLMVVVKWFRTFVNDLSNIPQSFTGFAFLNSDFSRCISQNCSYPLDVLSTQKNYGKTGYSALYMTSQTFSSGWSFFQGFAVLFYSSFV